MSEIMQKGARVKMYRDLISKKDGLYLVESPSVKDKIKAGKLMPLKWDFEQVCYMPDFEQIRIEKNIYNRTLIH